MNLYMRLDYFSLIYNVCQLKEYGFCLNSFDKRDKEDCLDRLIRKKQLEYVKESKKFS